MSGNDKLHYLLSQGTYELRMDMEDFDDQTRYVKDSNFNVGNESTKYIAIVSGYSWNVGRILIFEPKFISKIFDYCLIFFFTII